jgi:cytochrome c5
LVERKQTLDKQFREIQRIYLHLNNKGETIMNKRILLAGMCAAVLVACGTAKNSSPKVEALPTQADVDRVQAKFPGYTLDDLYQGKQLFESNCNLCHKLKNPASESESEWREIVPRMVKKVNNKEGHHIDEAGQEKGLRYVITMGSVEKS